MLLEVKDLTAGTEEREILHRVSLGIHKGETHVLMGPNGAGKSTLGNVLMGNPAYTVSGGTAVLDGTDLLSMPVNERAKAGLFMSFQNPLEVPGISLANFIRSAREQRTGEHVRLSAFRKEVRAALGILQMDASYAERDLNVGFSGGEKKKAEILQMLLLKPRLAILDETDSGLDVDAVRTVSRGIEEYQKDEEGTLLIITHSTRILEALRVDRVHILVNGQIAAEGGPDLIEEVNRDGFERFEEEREEPGREEFGRNVIERFGEDREKLSRDRFERFGEDREECGRDGFERFGEDREECRRDGFEGFVEGREELSRDRFEGLGEDR